MTFEQVWSAVGPLAGVAVGGVVSYFVNRRAEHHRWRQQKQDRLAEAKRQAIAKALSWIEPIEQALTSVQLKVGALLQLDMTDEKFLMTYPALTSTLAKRDATPEQRVLLPEDIYAAGHLILREMEELQHVAIRHAQETRLHNNPTPGHAECWAIIDKMREQHNGLRERLHKLYLETYD